MFARNASHRGNLAHLEQVEVWTRLRFGLADRDIVLVSEEAGRLPGYPQRLTVVQFWTADGQRYRFVVFKPVALVTEADLPIEWLLPALRDEGGECC